MNTQMKGWSIVSPGPIESTLKFSSDLKKPQLTKPDHLLVKVSHAALNPVDYKLAEFGFLSRAMMSYPFIQGADFSGIVESVGDTVKDLKTGDVVIGWADPAGKEGSLAEYLTVPRNRVAKIDETCDMEQAGGLSLTGLTAYQSMKPYVKSGDKIFINGGSGGVGTIGIQIAKCLGCSVTVSCSTGKVDLCKRLGADQCIDYTKSDVIEELTKQGKVYHHVVDNVASSPTNLGLKMHQFTVPDAQIVFITGDGKSAMHLGKSLYLPGFLGGAKRSAKFMIAHPNTEDHQVLADWFVQKRLEPMLDKTYPFEEAVEAYTYLKKGSSKGKIVVKVAQS